MPDAYRRPAAEKRSFRPLTKRDSQLMSGFYLGLSAEDRRGRFGGSLSDETVWRHCASVNWAQCLVYACVEGAKITALAELHWLAAYPQAAEIVLCCPECDAADHVGAHLVQLAVFAAAEAGGVRLAAAPETGDALMMRLLRDLGDVAWIDGMLWIDIADYAPIPVPSRQRTTRRSKFRPRLVPTANDGGGLQPLA